MVVDTTENQGRPLFGLTLAAMFLISALSVRGAQPAIFSAPANYVVGTNPTCVATAKVDGDALIDIVVGAQSGNSVSTLLNTGAGAFGVVTNTVITNGYGYPASLVVADFNHDNVPDLAVARDFPPGGIAPITVLIGRGDGSFVWATNYASGSFDSIAVGELNDDSNPDLVVGSNNGRVAVLLGNGDGTFAGPTNYLAGSTTIGWAVALGDINRDNRLDILTSGRFDKKVVVMLGNGDGTFQITTNYALAGNPQSVIVADVNNDGRLDVITANTGTNSLSVLLGNGDGTFQALPDCGLSAAPLSLAAADFNGDGFVDLVTANYLTTNATILLGNGDGTFVFGTNLSFSAEFRPQAVAVADFDSDGRPDVVAACYQTDPHAVPRPGIAAVFHNETPPALKARVTNGWMEISWPAWPGYQLQSSSNLALPDNWVPVTNIPFPSGNRSVVTNLPDAPSLFYRLRKP